MLIDVIREDGVDGKSVLDIGGGVGAIQHELLAAGAGEVVSVDGSSAYIAAATEEAGRRGHADRITTHHGDFVELAPAIVQADVVTLDRVICCYNDMEGLVALSAQHATKLLGLVYPRDTLVAKTIVGLLNLFQRLRRHPFRVFIHPRRAVEEVLRRNGLTQRSRQTTLVWQVVVWERA